MHRRKYLTVTTSAILTTIAGCSTLDPPPDGTVTPPETAGTPTNNTTPTESRQFPRGELSLTGGGCGSGEESATVSINETNVLIDGVISGSDSCKVAVLESVFWEEPGDKLVVNIAVEDEGVGKVCTQCITDIEYEADIETQVEPTLVEVYHHGEVLTSEQT